MKRGLQFDIMMRLLDAVGFRPQMFECANCGREILPKTNTSRLRRAGLSVRAVGWGCRTSQKYLWRRSSAPLSSLTEMLLAHAPALRLQKEAEVLMQGYFTYLLERELNTPGFIKKVNHKKKKTVAGHLIYLSFQFL